MILRAELLCRVRNQSLRVLSLCSDIGGRKWVYVISILVYAILNIVSIQHHPGEHREAAYMGTSVC